jgi:hypothetical protein
VRLEENLSKQSDSASLQTKFSLPKVWSFENQQSVAAIRCKSSLPKLIEHVLQTLPNRDALYPIISIQSSKRVWNLICREFQILEDSESRYHDSIE